MSTVDLARREIRRGRAVIPVPFRSKNPNRAGWETLILTEDDLPHYFNGQPSNIGVLNGAPSRGLHDVDCDWPMAAHLAPRFLPTTDCVFGRPASPESHSIYLADPLVKTTRFRDPTVADLKTATIVELRSTGTQTIWPGSTHPSGEQIVYAHDGEAALVDGRLLLAQVGTLAACCLLARHWPTGARHEAALALAGGLLRGGWSEESVETFLESVALAGGDDEVTDRIRAAADTARGLTSGRTTTGWPTLASLIDPRVVDRVREWLGMRQVAGDPESTDKRGSVSSGSASDEQKSRETWPTLDLAALHGLAGDVVRAILPHTEADPTALLVTFQALYGNAVGPTPHLMVGDDRHGVNEFFALVGETAKARKGSSRSGPQRIMKTVDPVWAADRIRGGLSSGEGLLVVIADEVTRPNKKGEEEIVVQGTTDKRLFCFEEELSQFLKVCRREGNILSEIVRRAWDARDLGTMTKASPLRVTRPHVSIIGHITKDELRRELDDIGAANGTGNRFAWCVVKRSKADPELEPMPEARVSDLAQRVQLAITHGRKTGRVKLDDDARMVWRNVYPDLSEGKPGLLGAVTARAEAHVLRFALIYALLDLSNTITTEHLTAALALWDYAEASATYIFGDATGDSIADRILTALRHNGEMAQADISDLFGRNVGAGRLGQALETLLSAGRATSRQQPPTDRDGNPTTGRPRTIWTATP